MTLRHVIGQSLFDIAVSRSVFGRENLYPFVWLDAIHYKIKEDGRYVSKAIYTILGLTVGGKKELLGLYVSESEGANYWQSVLTDLYNRGVEDILIACVDGLTGFPEAIATIYPSSFLECYPIWWGITLCDNGYSPRRHYGRLLPDKAWSLLNRYFIF